MSKYRLALQKDRKHREDALRNQVCVRNSKLLNERCLTPDAAKLLRTICSWYSSESRALMNDSLPDVEIELNTEEATRLWYRCGICLDSLSEIIDNRLEQQVNDNIGDFRKITSKDFIDTVQRVIKDEESQSYDKGFESDGEDSVHKFKVRFFILDCI